ncbi:MAG: putative inorganic carbon transporter subunit DabA, partial [Thiothrix sp.]
FHFAQHLALDAHAIQQMPRERIDKMLAILTELDDPHTSGYLWLRAYEYHYQKEVFSALLNKPENHGTPQPSAQFIFCMDDREESVRRHLEEIAPDIETFGAAGVFGLPNNWRALDAPRPLKLAQPVVTAVHELREVPTPAAQAYLPTYLRRLRWVNALRRVQNHRMRHDVLYALLSLPVLAPWALLDLLGRSLMPATYQRWLNRWQQRSKRKLPTRVQYTAQEPLACPSAEHNQLGWSFTEKVEKVAAFLKLTGFTRNFAPLVVLMAHRSRHLNNPHILGYGCGACSGRFGGPNARAFASMANEAAVREQLAKQHNIIIPDSCWFTAAEHDTTSDDVDWLDTELIPPTHQQIFQQVQQASVQAAQLSAQERCRKFASARVVALPTINAPARRTRSSKAG